MGRARAGGGDWFAHLWVGPPGASFFCAVQASCSTPFTSMDYRALAFAFVVASTRLFQSASDLRRMLLNVWCMLVGARSVEVGMGKD